MVQESMVLALHALHGTYDCRKAREKPTKQRAARPTTALAHEMSAIRSGTALLEQKPLHLAVIAHSQSNAGACRYRAPRHPQAEAAAQISIARGHGGLGCCGRALAR